MEPQIKDCVQLWQSPGLTETSLVSARRIQVLVIPRALSTSAGWIWPYPPDPSSSAHAVLLVVDARTDSYTLPLAAPGCTEAGRFTCRPLRLNFERQLSRQKSVFGGRSHFWETALHTAPGSLPPKPHIPCRGTISILNPAAPPILHSFTHCAGAVTGAC